ncbi:MULTISPECIES: hypothetical protein [unclassified Micromonospora]|uniref:hypothetical protein n=1 Tax=unclassified Micromonospora TaxID=2617518 RepID=UPI00363ADA7B
MTAILNPTGPAPLTSSPVPARPPAATARPTGTTGATGTSESAGSVGPVLVLPGTSPVAVVPVTRDGRPVGAFVLAGCRVRYRSLVAPDRMLAAAAAGALAVGLVTAAVAVVAGRRRPPAIGTVRMGPGGWVSLRGVRAPALRSTARRPWWAHVLRLRAHRLPESPR